MARIKFKLLQEVEKDIIDTFISEPVEVNIIKEEDTYSVEVVVGEESYIYYENKDVEIATNYAQGVIDDLAGTDVKTLDDVKKLIETDGIDLDEVVDQDNFIESPELEELREILLNVEEEIELLLLDDDIIVIGLQEEGTTFLYTLPDESEDFVLIVLPLEKTKILSNKDIIKYTPDNIDNRHQTVVDLLSKLLIDVTEDEEDEEVEEQN